jgi:hypothetical protein
MQVYRRLSELKKYHIEALDGRIGKTEEHQFINLDIHKLKADDLIDCLGL